MPEPNSLQAAAESFSALTQAVLVKMLGAGAATPLFGRLALADFIAALILLVLTAVLLLVTTGWVRSFRRRHEERKTTDHWPYQVVIAFSKPVYAAIWVVGIYLALLAILSKTQAAGMFANLAFLLRRLVNISVFAIIIWLFYRMTAVLRTRLLVWARKTESKSDDLLVPPVIRTLQVVLPLLAVILGLPVLNLPPAYDLIVSKISSLVLIGVVAWVLVQGVRLAEGLLLARYNLQAADNLEARKIYTQVKVLGKTAYVIISILTVGSMLMVFDEARRFGTNLLASAGVVGVILGFAAQRTISNLFAGFQLAMTQPIRLDDVVVVEGEWGRVEEITLTYVVVNIWDQRRLILPLSYFIEKPFQNWTRVSSEIIGTVFVYADYTVPLAEIRAEVKRLVENHPKWDKRFWNVQVTDATERSIQLRVLVTSSDSGKSWDLRCDVREGLIDFLQKHHEKSLPKVRAEVPALPAPAARP